MKSLLAVALGLFVSVASIQAASADAAPCGCGSRQGSDPGGGFGGQGGKGGATGGGGTAGSGGGTAGSGGATGGGGSAGSTTSMRSKQGTDQRADLPAPCTEYAASPASNPTGEFVLGMSAFFVIPLARRRTKKRGK